MPNVIITPKLLSNVACYWAMKAQPDWNHPITVKFGNMPWCSATSQLPAWNSEPVTLTLPGNILFLRDADRAFSVVRRMMRKLW